MLTGKPALTCNYGVHQDDRMVITLLVPKLYYLITAQKSSHFVSTKRTSTILNSSIST